MQSLDEKRIEALQEALIEYVGRYGLTELAIRAFKICATDDDNSMPHKDGSTIHPKD